MALDLQDQEELENAKRAWKLWGRWVFLAMLIAAALYLGNIVWKGQIEKRNAAAASIYDKEFQPKLIIQDTQNMLIALQKLQKEYPNSFATSQATIEMADVSFSNAKYDDAANHLKWLLQNQKQPIIRALTVQRLSVVYFQQEKYDEALKIIEQEKLEPEFAARINNLKGDIYAAQGKKKEAQQAYNEALKQLPLQDVERKFIEVKSKL